MINQVRRLYEDVYNKVDINVCKELCSSSLKLHDPAIPNGRGGFDTFCETEKKYKKAFHNKKAKIEQIFAVDNKVVVLWSCTGKHDGVLQGIEPTGLEFNISGISVYQFEHGKICEIWQSWDRLNLLEQLGIVQREAVLH